MFVALRRLLRRAATRGASRAARRLPVSLPPPRPADPADTDPIGTVVGRGLAAPYAGAPPAALHRAARRFFSRNAPAQDTQAAFAQLLGFVEAYPRDEELQVLAGRMLERSTFSQTATGSWSGISDRFPGSAIAFSRRIGCMSRERGAEAAHSWMLDRFPEVPGERNALVSYAAGFSQLVEYDLADAGHEALLRVAPRDEESYLLYARSLEKRGEHDLAVRILDQGRGVLGIRARGIEALSVRLSHRAKTLRRAFPELEEGETAHRDVMRLMLAEAAQGRSPAAPASGHGIGKILLITGSLGAGGAERQFVTTALGLRAAASSGTSVAGRTLTGPVEVLCRSLTSRADADFFLPTLAAAGIPVGQMAALPEERGRAAASCVKPYLRFLDYLPQRVAEGMLRLSDEIRERAPDVVHIWQDGMVLSAGAAALIAGVPRIVLSARTMPPVDRLGRKKPEYETLYRGLLDASGVAMTANSARAAQRYAAWLDLPPERIGVVRNGVRPLPREPGEAAAALAEDFEARTGPSRFTLGCVLRFDENKRPGPWLGAAAQVLAAIPDARFILVGDGPLLASAKEHAQALGLSERTLFVGRSADVGFWLSRMSVFLLLSGVEGLPNGPIEAQLAGVPVVTTPAGGAAESILPGVTGEVLSSAENLDLDEIAACLVALAHDPARRAVMAREAVAWAERAFSVKMMIAATVATYAP